MGPLLPLPSDPSNSTTNSQQSSNSLLNLERVWQNKGKIALVVAAGGLACFAYCRYHVCTPSQYLVKTGLGIADMEVARKTLQWPLQEVRTYNMNPLNYTFQLNNMSSEMVPFRLPGDLQET